MALEMNVNENWVKALKDYSENPDKGVLRLVNDDLTFINTEGKPLPLWQRIQKFFGWGGYNLKKIWLFFDQKIRHDQQLEKYLGLEKLNETSELFDEKASNAFAFWRVTKSVREIFFNNLRTILVSKQTPSLTTSPGGFKVPDVISSSDIKGDDIEFSSADEEIQDLEKRCNQIPDISELKTIKDQEHALRDGIRLAKSFLKKDRTHLSQNSFDRCAEIEFEFIEKLKQIYKSIKKHSGVNPAVISFEFLICNIPAFRVLRYLKEGIKQGNEKSIGRLNNHLDTKLIGTRPSDLVNPYREHKLHKNTKADKSEDHINWKARWREIRRNVYVTAQEWRPVQSDKGLESKKITWITGTSTATLVPIFKMAHPSGPALIPTGQLLRRNIVPLTGELEFGLEGVNRSHLSGTVLSRYDEAVKYSEEAKKRFAYDKVKERSILQETIKDLTETAERGQSLRGDYLSRLKISIIRLAWSGLDSSEREKIINDLKNIKEKISQQRSSNQWEKHIDLFSVILPNNPFQERRKPENHTYTPGQMVLVPTSQGGYAVGVIDRCSDSSCSVWYSTKRGINKVSYDELIYLSDDDLNLIKKNYPNATRSDTSSLSVIEDYIYYKVRTDLDWLDELIQLTESTEQVQLSEQDEKLIANPGSILWGTSTKEDKDLIHVHSDIPGERGLEGPQKLGEDIQVLFVEPEKLEEVRTYVKKHLPAAKKVHIVSTRVIPFLNTYRF